MKKKQKNETEIQKYIIKHKQNDITFAKFIRLTKDLRVAMLIEMSPFHC